MCHRFCIAQDHSFLSFLLWVFCCFSILVFFEVGLLLLLFCYVFHFDCFFQEQTQRNFCTHGVTRVDSVWAAMMLNSWSDAEFLKWLLFSFVQLLSFLNSLYNIEIIINFVVSIMFQFFTILAFETMIYVSKMEIDFALIFWEIFSTLVLLSFSSEQIKNYLLFSLTFWIL